MTAREILGARSARRPQGFVRMKTVNDFAFYFATFSLQNIAGLGASLDGKI